MATERPPILELTAITPTPESARSDRLEYGNLQSIVEQHGPYESERMNDFWDAEIGSLEERRFAQTLAKHYMLKGSLALQLAGTTSDKELWSDRYTQASSEIYGLPEASMAQDLWQAQEAGEAFALRPEHEKVAGAFREYLERTYAPVYESLERDISDEPLAPSEVADRFQSALDVLKNYDSDWDGWTIDRDEEKDMLSISPFENKITVGMRRSHMDPKKLRGLFSHEVLIHAARAVNGRKISDELGKGLSGYIDLEEGLGTFVEYALNGEVSQKNIDRYVDIAFALGQIDGVKHTRAELLEHAMRRAHARNETIGGAIDEENIVKEVYSHVNRIYRGSLGNEHIGIYTKDVMYLKGFLEISEYLSKEVNGGKNIDEVVKYLLQGKFDPTDPAHVAYVDSVTAAPPPLEV